MKNMTGEDQEHYGMKEMMDTDLDENLSELDKPAVFSQRSSSPQTQTQHDQNLTEAKAEAQGAEKLFCTGLVISSVSYDLYKRLLAAAERRGLSLDRRLEVTGVWGSQMALTLLGGPNRLTPENCTSGRRWCCSAGRRWCCSAGRRWCCSVNQVDVTLFLPNFVKMQESISTEVTLFNKTSSRHVLNIRVLPVTPVDRVIISCLDSHENVFLRQQSWYQAAVDWANQNRAPV